MFGLCSFDYAHRRKIINIKKIVQFMLQNQLYTIFGRTQVKVILFWKNCLFFFFFHLILSLHDAFRNLTRRINEKALYLSAATISGMKEKVGGLTSLGNDSNRKLKTFLLPSLM